jgi:hypothetical protein
MCHDEVGQFFAGEDTNAAGSPATWESTVESQNGWSGGLQDSLEKCYNEKSDGRYGDEGDS